MTIPATAHLDAFRSRLGVFLKQLRMSWDGSQDAAAEISRVSQGEISRIERGEVLPNLTTVSRLLTAYAKDNPALYAVYFQQVMSILHDSVESSADWIKNLDVDTADAAKERAEDELLAGNILDALPYIVAVKLLAESAPERANADLLFGVHMSDLGLYDLATRYFNAGLQELGPGGAACDEETRTLRQMLLVNKADLLRKMGLLDEADALVSYVLGADPHPTIEHFAGSVRGRLEVQRGNVAGAVDILRASVAGYTSFGEPAASTRDWVTIFLAEALSLDPATRGEGRALLEDVLAHAGPAGNPRDAENHTWANLMLAIHHDDDRALALAKRGAVAGRLGEVLDILGEIEESGARTRLPLQVGVFRWRNLRPVFWGLALAALASSAFVTTGWAKGCIRLFDFLPK